MHAHLSTRATFAPALALAVALLAGCGGYSEQLDGDLIGAAGGQVEARGLTLDVPEGALPAGDPVLIRAVPLDDGELPAAAWQAGVVRGTGHRLEPAGLTLAKAGTLTIVCRPELLAGLDTPDLAVVRFGADGREEEPLAALLPIARDTAGASIDQLGLFAVVLRCAADADCPAGEQCRRLASGEGRCVAAGTELCGDGLDNDGDGQIDEGCPACSDEDGDGYTGCVGDCDDQDPAVHPGAVELRNGVDDDCDGATDEQDCVPAAEICDGLDNDCDGQIDEGCQLCSQDGDCPAGLSCVNGICRISD